MAQKGKSFGEGRNITKSPMRDARDAASAMSFCTKSPHLIHHAFSFI